MNNETDNTISIEAEQAVLGALMADPEAIDRCAFLDASHFYRHDHRLIFSEMQRQHATGQTPDPISLMEKLHDKVTDCLPYLIKLRTSEPSGARARQHSDIVIEKAKKRALLALAVDIQAGAVSHQLTAEIADAVSTRLEELTRSRTSQDPVRMSNMMHEYVLTLEKRQTGIIRPISTGLEDLDFILGGGLEPGTLTVIAGRPGSGKTALALGIARYISESEGALFLSMEMARQKVLDRLVAAMAGVPLSWTKRPDLDETQWGNLTRAIQMAQDMDLFIDDQTALNMLAIRAKSRKVRRMLGKLQVLVIDQLSFITGSKLERTHDQVGEYTRALVNLAKDMGLAVVLLCQLNRKCEDRPNKRPMISDLAESGKIEQDADTIIFTYRDEYYNPDSPDKGTGELIVAKQRDGTPGMARVAWVGEQTKFANLAKTWMRAPAPDSPRRRIGGGGFGAD